MKHVAKTVDASVNLPTVHPLVDLAWLVGGMLCIMLIIFVGGGVLVDQLAKHIPPEYDNKLGTFLPTELFTEFGTELTEGPLVDKTRALFEELVESLPEDDTRTYTLTIIDTEVVNALALPGSHLVLFRGLIEQAQTENEIAMVLAHEFGHVYHRHHWRKLGRSALFTITALMAGSQSAASGQLAGIPLTTLMQANSRSHETESDLFAIDLICRHYGHAGGATDFFIRNRAAESHSDRLASFLLTHPLSQQRIDDIDARARESGCPDGPVSNW